MNYSNIENTLKDKDLIYPILAWAEIGDNSEILLISSPKVIQSLGLDKNGNLKALFTKLAGLINSQDLRKTAQEGDAELYKFTIISPELNEFNWDILVGEFQKELSLVQPNANANEKVRQELKAFINMDLAASAIKCVYSSMFYTLISKAAELGITQIMFLGEMIYDEVLMSIIDSHLPDHFKAYTMDL